MKCVLQCITMCSKNTASLQWNLPLVKNNFQTCCIYLFQRNTDVSKEFCIIWKTIKHHTFFEQGLFWSIKYLLQEKNAYSAKSCYICRRDGILFEVKLLVFNACHVFRALFCNPFLPARSMVFYQMGMRSFFEFSFECLHVKK